MPKLKVPISIPRTARNIQSEDMQLIKISVVGAWIVHLQCRCLSLVLEFGMLSRLTSWVGVSFVFQRLANFCSSTATVSRLILQL
ncbi:hypothetical protein T4E_4321 [Trichinella pseudospiralis]|uniref:Uncharacterized protein n=1 Tax=Trichinella pseudospiralis TaxID=6337 RepID=A0A0V0X4Z1_TRIPS|nr:hypothetical protein T4E_4321 [Trichinella pseudospiralis]